MKIITKIIALVILNSSLKYSLCVVTIYVIVILDLSWKTLTSYSALIELLPYSYSGTFGVRVKENASANRNRPHE